VSPESVHFPGFGQDEVQGLLERPSESGRSPAIVLVHEVFGVGAHIRAMARRFASEGYVVLAPDLYSRESVPAPMDRDRTPTWTVDQVSAAVARLPDRRVLGDLEGALAYLARDPEVDPSRLAAAGFCTGGNYAFLLGCTSTRLSAVVDFYGRFVYSELGPNKPVQPLELALNLSCPVLFLFGEEDPSIARADVERLRETLTRFARDFEIVTFPGAGQGFMNDRRQSYDAAAAARAFEIAVDFLRERLVPS
jgi:carboxymethylenebutenolidase